MYQPLPSLGMVLAGTGWLACTAEYALMCICAEQNLTVIENTLGKVRGTGTVETMYIVFENFIMTCTAIYSDYVRQCTKKMLGYSSSMVSLKTSKWCMDSILIKAACTKKKYFHVFLA